MKKQQLLQDLGDAHQNLLQSVDGLAEDEMTHAGVVGAWSVKDVLGHVAFWNVECVKAIHQVMRGEFPYDYVREDYDQPNALQIEKRRNWPLAKIRNELDDSYRVLVGLIEGLGEVDMTRAWGPRWRDQEDITVPWLVWGILQHYQDHQKHIEAWRGKRAA